MTEQQQRRAEAARLLEEARIEGVENELRMHYNATATTELLLPYRNDAHIALVCHTDKILRGL